MASLEFPFRTGKVTIDLEKCRGCETHACVDACARFGGSLFKVEDSVPALIPTAEEAGRRCIEDLACELYCQDNGNKGLRITLDMFGLDEYRKKIGLACDGGPETDGDTR